MDIFGAPYQFEYVKSLVHEGDELIGFHDPENRTIYIDSDIPDTNLHNITLLHELGHGICDRLGAHDLLSIDLEDILVDGWARYLVEKFEMKLK